MFTSVDKLAGCSKHRKNSTDVNKVVYMAEPLESPVWKGNRAVIDNRQQP